MYNKENTKEAETILERISAELERKKITQAKLVEFLDLPKGTYSSWKAGRSRSFCEHLGAISQFLGISTEYLVNGRVSEHSDINPRELALLESFRKLSPEKQDVVAQNIKWLAD